MTSHVYVDISRRMERAFYEVLAHSRYHHPYADVYERINRREGEHNGTEFAERLLRIDGQRSQKCQLILLEVAAESRRNMVQIRASGVLRQNVYLVREAAYDEGYYYGIMGVVSVTWPMTPEGEASA